MAIPADRVAAIRADLDRREALMAEAERYTLRAIGERHHCSYNAVWLIAHGQTKNALRVPRRQCRVSVEAR